MLHPEFVNGKYAFYTRPQDSFIDAGQVAVSVLDLCDDIENAVIEKEIVIDKRVYHTVYEAKNGLGLRLSKQKMAGCTWHMVCEIPLQACGMFYICL